MKATTIGIDLAKHLFQLHGVAQHGKTVLKRTVEAGSDNLEFYATVDTQSEVINDQLAEWQHYYNWDRPHSPMERFFELIHQTPFSDEVDSHYVPEKERIRDPNYRLDLQLSKLKRSL